MAPAFQIRKLNLDALALDDGARTVATITRQGYIDWLLRGPAQRGPRLEQIDKETHLSYVRGFKMQISWPTFSRGQLQRLTWQVSPDGSAATLVGEETTADGRFRTQTMATVRVGPVSGQYEWEFESELVCTAEKPVSLSWIEYNNMYPAKAGRCMLFAPDKEYHSTLMVDREGVVWEFPHQHLMHYGRKIAALEFAVGTLAGFFGEQTGSPVCIVHESPLPPDWGICDMYYDLHCGARPQGPIQPGQRLRWRYTAKYLDPEESRTYIRSARAVPVTAEDWQQHTYPRLELGLNHFDSAVAIDRMDDASGFRQRPPKLVWDRETGHRRKGSLRLTNATPEVTVWSAEPPTQIPSETDLRLAALVKTSGVEGKGLYLRVRYHTFVWHPTPHVEWTKELVSTPVGGTTNGWVRVEVPLLRVPREHVDYLVWIDVVLDGKGTAWVTDVDVDLVRVRAGVPVDA